MSQIEGGGGGGGAHEAARELRERAKREGERKRMRTDMEESPLLARSRTDPSK